MTVYAALRALHLLCGVLWVGGMFFAYVVLRPSMAAIETPQRMILHTSVFKKFFLVIWHAMPLILLSGFAMVGLRWNLATAPWQLNAMLGLGLLMAIVFLIIFFGPYRRFRRTTDRIRMASSLDSIRKLIGVNLLLGLITIIVAGLL